MNQSKKAIRDTKWQSLVEEQEKSGLSQTKFCKQKNIVLSQFTYYRGLIKAKVQSDVVNSKSFTPIQINKNASSISADVRIVLPNGFQCFIPCHIDVLSIKRLVEVLLSC